MVFPMMRRFLTIAMVLCVLSYFAGMWIESSIAMATPLETFDQTPQAICNGTGDMRAFFRSLGFTEDFRVTASMRDEALSRRYYRVRLSPGAIPKLRQQLLANWTLGHFNRVTYENNLSARVKRSRNLPGWWNLSDPPKADHIMLAHGGDATWYIVLTDEGEACLMWAH
jgi:hypothetical protein